MPRHVKLAKRTNSFDTINNKAMDDKQTNIMIRHKTQKYQRVIGLDLLRISLAILVLLFHSQINVLHCDYGLLNYFVNMGPIAMTGFFLLSGYALNLSTQKMNMTVATDINKFYLKRLISIIPLYYAWALLNVAIKIAVKGTHAAIEELMLFPIETLGLQSIFASLFSFSHNGASWFISCILICYFVYPLIQTLTKDINDRTRIGLIVLLGVILLWSPFIQYFFHTATIYDNPFFRVFEFTIGILVCQMNIISKTNIKLIRILRTPMACILSIVMLIIGVSIAVKLGIPGGYMFYSWIALPCFISLLISLGYLKFERLQGSKCIEYMSALSYSIFLSQMLAVWHSIRIVMEYLGCSSNIANILLSATICFGIANLFHYLIEIPSSKYLKAKFSESKKYIV